jgi:hypothetical protein
MNNIEWRLPKSISPILYNLTLNFTDYKIKKEYNGNIEISFLVKQPTKCLIFHIEEIKIINIELIGSNNKFLKFEENKNSNFLKIMYKYRFVVDDQLKLKINFIGKIRRDYIGVFIPNNNDILLTNFSILFFLLKILKI